MYITTVKSKGKQGSIYRTVLLRESYREDAKVKTRTVANLGKCTDEEIGALNLALKHKGDLSFLKSINETLQLEEGPSVGAVWTIYQVAERLGIVKALGNNFQSQLAIWQVMARLISQGSRLSATRLATTHLLAPVIGFQRGFDENNLYDNLHWLADNQVEIENALFKGRTEGVPHLFLYDVTSTYLEGEKNELADWGYNRDKKKGKKQIVVGLMCDKEGDPISIQVFKGNTSDLSTFAPQVHKAAKRFGCENVVFVGDGGMIKSKQIEELTKVGFHYITSIGKPQIERLVREGTFQMDLFDIELCEVIENDQRYLLRRNPLRAEELEKTRKSKQQTVEKLLQDRNQYLQDHPKADVKTALKKGEDKISQLKLQSWLCVNSQERTLSLSINEEALEEAAKYDGCYVIKTDLKPEQVSSQVVHDRYKDLIRVEHAFRTSKMDWLNLRPVYVRSEKSTYGHVFIVMLAYKITRELRKAWSHLDVTPQEGLIMLETLSSMQVTTVAGQTYQRIPKPRKMSQKLLESLGLELPPALPDRKINVGTRKKLGNLD